MDRNRQFYFKCSRASLLCVEKINIMEVILEVNQSKCWKQSRKNNRLSCWELFRSDRINNWISNRRYYRLSNCLAIWGVFQFLSTTYNWRIWIRKSNLGLKARFLFQVLKKYLSTWNWKHFSWKNKRCYKKLVSSE